MGAIKPAFAVPDQPDTMRGQPQARVRRKSTPGLRVVGKIRSGAVA